MAAPHARALRILWYYILPLDFSLECCAFAFGAIAIFCYVSVFLCFLKSFMFVCDHVLSIDYIKELMKVCAVSSMRPINR